MSITIQLNPSLEHRLRENAQKKGVGVDQFVMQFLERNFPEEKSGALTVSKREAELLHKVNLNIPSKTWDLYLQLKAKRQSKTATEAELSDLQSITAQVEVANAQRIAVLAELAQIRNVSIRVLMEQLGLVANHE
ncbi:MAG: hypothetical protein ACKVU0_14535 [Saprospiraceae bacterium]